jgi:hypothetical protein
MKDIIDILRDIAEVEHWTRIPAVDAGDDNLACPPVISWKYKHPSGEVAEFFRRAIKSFPGTLTWEFSTNALIWALMPTRIREYATSHKLSGTLSAVGALKETDPDFGICANKELPFLAKHIQHHLEINRQRVS